MLVKEVKQFTTEEEFGEYVEKAGYEESSYDYYTYPVNVAFGEENGWDDWYVIGQKGKQYNGPPGNTHEVVTFLDEDSYKKYEESIREENVVRDWKCFFPTKFPATVLFDIGQGWCGTSGAVIVTVEYPEIVKLPLHKENPFMIHMESVLKND